MTVNVDVAVIGAGISGVGAAIKLLEAGVDDFVVLEKGTSIGGVWRDNTYPGCACDVPSILYSYSFAPNPHWSRSYAGQAEILAYLQLTAERHGVLAKVRFGVEVLGARWDPATSRWRLTTTQGDVAARSLIAAAGPWHQPNVPDVPGLESFPGPVFHSSRWDHDVELVGKRVAVIGNGASAVQFVPEIVAQVAELHLFQRTPQWVLPKSDRSATARRTRIAARIPGAHQATWYSKHLRMELVGLLFRHRLLQGLLRAAGAKNIHAGIEDPALREVLTPSWDVGCKRLLMSNDYYPALARPHVVVHPTALTTVRDDTVVGADGTEVQVDVLIFATGFKILDMPIARRIRAASGSSLAQQWQGSPQAYLGTTVTGFPNLYLLFGPGLGAVTSGFFIVESQLRHIMRALAHQRVAQVDVEVRAAAQQRHNDELQSALQTSVYNAGGCRSYFLDANGRNSFSWPWTAARLRRQLDSLDLRDYVSVPSSSIAPDRATADDC